ncbi:DUF2190 family protein [Atlantibacter hermannii]|uniref:DUF2190 family protein n=1 Tax=Atlantibacter hermannii TaxID=565 RepID=UPI0028AD1C68|nr:DUF2190 family protein [Atlantibacter hermannii]
MTQYDIPIDGQGVLMMTGIFTPPKVAAETWQRGERIWLTADGKLTSQEQHNSSNTNAIAGTAWATTNPNNPEGRVHPGF